MDATLAPSRNDINAFAASALKASGRFWFAVMLVGQTAFALYIAAFYGTWAARGDLAAWNKTIPHGYVPGETMGNAALVGHLLFAALFGFDPKSFTGPFLTGLALAQYALPLALVQLYLHAQKHGQALGKLATAATIGAFTLLAGVGILGAMMGMWMPRITSLLAG